VVGDGAKKQGTHITMVYRVSLKEGLVYTVEGNARGLLPDSTVGEGVIKRTRPLPKRVDGPGLNKHAKCPLSGLPQSAEVMHVYRFLPADFVVHFLVDTPLPPM
jgi:hypothetical protein